MKKLFLDDVRSIQSIYPKAAIGEFTLVRSYEEFVAYIETHGLPDFISFDNDLGLLADGSLAPDGLAAAKWLVYYSGLDLRRLKFHVHSANPVASVQIKSLLDNYIKFLNSP